MTDVAGYRVLRAAAHGARTRLLLGHDGASTAVLKVSDAGDARFAVEAEALARAAGDHVVGLLDAARDESDAVLVLERLDRGTLAELLERRAGLDAGEAVTILAPLAATVERIHLAGVAHGSLSLSAVCFAADGSPTLVGFGSAELFAAGAPEVVRESFAGVLADRAALRALVGIVLSRVIGARADAARRLGATIGESSPAQLVAALFDLAAAQPVRFESDPDAISPRVVELGEPEEASPPTPLAVPPWLWALVPDPLRERVAPVVESVVERVAAVWSGWDTRRRRITLAVVTAGATAALALSVIPAGAPAAVDAAPLPGATPSTSPVHELPDDPVEAAVVLLALRQECLRDLSLLCLDAVGQPDSAALIDDRMLIRDVIDGGEFPQSGVLDGDLTLVERLGDSALVDLPAGSDPSSLLLMHTADGWRIRDYLPGVPTVVTP